MLSAAYCMVGSVHVVWHVAHCMLVRRIMQALTHYTPAVLLAQRSAALFLCANNACLLAFSRVEGEG